MIKYIILVIVRTIVFFPLVILVNQFDIGPVNLRIGHYIMGFIIAFIGAVLYTKVEYDNHCIKLILRKIQYFLSKQISLDQLYCAFIENNMIRHKVKRDSRKYHDYYEEAFIKFLRLDDKSLKKIDTNSLEIPFRYRTAFRIFCERLRLRYELDIHTLSIEERLTIFAAKAQPNWLNLDYDYLVQLYQSFPRSYSFNEKIKITRQRLLTIYKYEQTPPFWIKKPEWVVENGEPFCFMYQQDRLDSNSVDYIFYHKERKIEVVITQSYSVLPSNSLNTNQIS